MEYLLDLTVWQYAIALLMVIGGFYASAKNRPIYAKLVFMVGLTILVAMQLFKVPQAKETALDSRIRLERQLLTSYEGRPGMPVGYSDVIAKLSKINGGKDRNNADVVEPLLTELEGMKYPQPFMKTQVDSLVEAWKTRIQNTPAALKEELATLEAKPEKSAADKQRIAQVRSMLPAWYDLLPLKFGLDLRGGTEVRLRLYPEREKLDSLTRQLNELKGNPEADPERIADLEKEVADEEGRLSDSFQNASDVIRSRLNGSGLEEIGVSAQGNDKLLIQMPGMSSADAQGIINRLKKLGRLEFRMAVSAEGNNSLVSGVRAAAEKAGIEADHLNYSPNQGRFLAQDEIVIRGDEKKGPEGEDLYDWMHDASGTGMVIRQQIELTGKDLESARARPSSENPGSYEIAFWLNNTGALIFQNLTSNNIGKNLAIILDGKLKSAPRINSTISRSGTITGNFTPQESKDLEVVLKSGSLQTRVEVDFENTVGPTLGEDSIKAGINAMGIGLAVVLVFMLLYYRLAGLVTDVILFVNMVLILALLSAMGATLTLPGIAGLILTVGMAVDANVLIFERIREERAKGQTLARAIQLGYERAFVTIVDANVTTFLTALILHQFGTEAVKGFAMTLIIGIICSVFTSLVFTRWCFEALLHFKMLHELKMARFFKNPSFSFTKWRRPAMFLSAACIIVGLVFVGIRGEKNLSQDFTGGLFAQIALTEHMAMNDARDKIEALYEDFSDLTIQSYGQAKDGKFKEFILRTAQVRPEAEKNAPATTEEGAAKGKKQLKTAGEFRAELEKLFPLQNNGLQITEKRIAEKSTPDKAAFQIDISMETPRTTEEIVNMVNRNTLLSDVEAVTPTGESVNTVSVIAKLPVRGADGEQRDDGQLNAVIRDQLQKLRSQGLLEFTEPFPRFSAIGASVASEMIRSAIMALVYSMVAIFVYIWLRFQFRASFGAGAVLALVHDVLFTVGALAIADQLGILNGQISLTVVAALLTLVGYSLNDTIVVFDRIRENMRSSGKGVEELIDASINQTISRTVITSLTTLVVVLALLFAGGEVIQGFAFTLFIGILVGTYSSIFIASPVLVEFMLYAKHRKERKARERIEAEEAANKG